VKVEFDGTGHEDVLRTFASVPDDVEVVVAFRMTAKRAREVLARGSLGPPWLSTRQCAELIGGSRKKWAEWAVDGLIEGAKRDGAGDWRIPNDRARAYYERHLNGDQSSTGAGKQQRASGAGSSPSPANRKASGRRGPRKATLAAIRGGRA
jgi:hypothetical protein